MDACKEYIDKSMVLIQMLFDGEGNSRKADVLRDELDIPWNAMTEEEQMYADEQILRTQIYMGGIRECESRDNLQRVNRFYFE